MLIPKTLACVTQVYEEKKGMDDESRVLDLWANLGLLNLYVILPDFVFAEMFHNTVFSYVNIYLSSHSYYICHTN